MAFTALPRMYDSVAGELIYTLTGLDAAGHSDVHILDARSGDTLSLKRFYRTAEATVNAAPAARTAIRFTPPAGLTGIRSVPERSAKIVVEAAGERSPVRLFTAGGSLPDLPSVPTTLPARRTLAQGEYEELTLLVPDNGQVELTRRMMDGTSRSEVFRIPSGNEPVAFVIESDRYAPDSERLDLVVSSAGEAVCSFTYDLVIRPAGARRVAWRSSAGSIEHFTFPVEMQLCQNVGQDNAPVRPGTVFGPRSRILTLLSGYLPRREVAALAEIVRSPEVWIVANTGYVRVLAEGGRHELRSGSGPSQIELRLRIPES